MTLPAMVKHSYCWQLGRFYAAPLQRRAVHQVIGRRVTQTRADYSTLRTARPSPSGVEAGGVT